MMIITFAKDNKVERSIKSSFQRKNYYLVKNLSLYFIFLAFDFFSICNLFLVGAPTLEVSTSIVLYFILFLIYVALNLLFLFPNFSVAVGKISPNFKKSSLQKFTENLLSFLLSYALVFYLAYKAIWLSIPNAVNQIGDNLIIVLIGVVGIPLAFPIFPIYSMKEKIVKGYLVDKYYEEFKKDDNYKTALKL